MLLLLLLVLVLLLLLLLPQVYHGSSQPSLHSGR
jgi:hypothetical protein